jgi:hypothetical protein
LRFRGKVDLQMNFFETLKQLQSLVPGILPYVTAKLPLFPFLNPSIMEDLWPITSILSLLASAITFNLAKSRTTRTLVLYHTLALYLCFFGLAASIASFLIMNAIVSKIFLPSSPPLQDYAVQITFVSLFIGIGFTSGWCFAKILQSRPARKTPHKKADQEAGVDSN